MVKLNNKNASKNRESLNSISSFLYNINMSLFWLLGVYF